MRIALAAIAVAALAACQTMDEADAPRATASLQPTKGSKTFGEATFELTSLREEGSAPTFSRQVSNSSS